MRRRTGMGSTGGPAHLIKDIEEGFGAWVQAGVEESGEAQTAVCATAGTASGADGVVWPTTQQRAGTPAGAQA